MSSTVQRGAKSERQTPFYRDLASPISAHRGRFASPGQAAAVSALWRDNLGGLEPPPPPVFTLDERADFSPENGLAELPLSPDFKSETRTPSPMGVSPSPLKSRAEVSTSSALFAVESSTSQQQQQTPGISSWWSPVKSSFVDHDEKGKGSPVDGVVQPGALIMLPPLREVARPELQKNSLPTGSLDEEEWVTVYGFSPSDTNLVLREFEKFGVILKHVPGPRDANWIHILYQAPPAHPLPPDAACAGAIQHGPRGQGELLSASGVLGDHGGPPTGARRSSQGWRQPQFIFSVSIAVALSDGAKPPLLGTPMVLDHPRCPAWCSLASPPDAHPAHPSTGRSTLLGPNRYDAQKALSRNGTQINSVLIVGVKPLDPTERRFLDEKLDSSNHLGFMVPLPASSGRRATVQSPLTASSRPYVQSNTATISDGGRHAGGAIATPAKSVVSKVMDLMFGI
ncbi:hypothetical protein Taro_040920 [Colocasia esculenta]|uniref:RRM Nup35-type domain-containing protein n=1 Tax=Colocasia esculenta TaxID=4460 RepID=A0A843WZF1_COLES|nr:hypothetical protein [Colocasia esculenta]